MQLIAAINYYSTLLFNSGYGKGEFSTSELGGLLVVPRHRLSSYGRRVFFCGQPCDMELVTRQSEKPGHQQRLLQAFTEDVFIYSLLVHITH